MTVTIATFMELLDTSIANVSLPHIAGGLATSYDESTWVLTSYLIANAVVLPLSAWLSRVFGRKRYYMACVAIFSVSSVLCGFAPSLASLIAFRLVVPTLVKPTVSDDAIAPEALGVVEPAVGQRGDAVEADRLA